MYVIIGATGKTGGAAAEKLTFAWRKVRVIGRDATTAGTIHTEGRESIRRRCDRLRALLRRHFSGAKAVYR